MNKSKNLPAAKLPPKNSRWLPPDLPKPLALLLIGISLLLGLSGMRYRGVEGVLHTLENWLFMLAILPLCICLIAMPIKWRDRDFDLRLTYFMGIFVGVLFMMGKLRYWR